MPSSDESMKLQVITKENAITRSDGINDLNENLFVTLDYYFFANAADNDDNKLLLHKSETGLNENNEHTYKDRISDADLAAVYGTIPADGDKCYVYVVANLDETTRSTINNNASISLKQLKRVKFQTVDISKDGKQESFVMYGGDNVTLSIKNDKKGLSGQIKVIRDAAKVVLTVTNVENIVELGEGEAKTYWKSDPANMYVMFFNGVNKSMINSQINQDLHYIPSGPADDCFFTLDQTSGTENLWRKLVAASTSEPNKNLKHEYPFYTYLSNWNPETEDGIKERASYMILMVPWQQVDATGEPVGSLGFQHTYYQIETTPVDEHAYYENTFYQIFINVGVLGSFEIPEPVKVEAKYSIVPWGSVDVPATLREGRYLILETNKYTVNNQPSGSIPFVTSHKITQAYVTNVNYLVLRSFREENIPNTSDTDGTLTVNTYREYTSGNNGEGSQTIRNLQETFTVTTTNNILTLSHDIKPNQYTRYEVTVKIVNEAGLSEEAVFTIYPAIYTNKQNGGNSFINGYFGNVSSPEGGTWVLNRDGSYRVRQNRGGTAEAGDDASPYHIWAGGATNYNGNNTEANTYGSLITGSPGLSTTFTRITVTSFTEDDEKFNVYYITRENNQGTPSAGTLREYTYKLTDPRVQSNWSATDLHPYVETRSSSSTSYTTKQWTNAGSIMVGTAESDKIAPDILVTSAWGRCNPNSITFGQAQKRCATYQEAGYPAGRWRLPTIAEISYIYTLQELGVINNLFAPNHSGGYWSSEGHPMRFYNGNPSLRTTYTGLDPVRCVYDLWYWGEEQQTQNEYHAMPTKNNN